MAPLRGQSGVRYRDHGQRVMDTAANDYVGDDRDEQRR